MGAATSFAGAQAGKIIGPALAKLGNTIGGWFKNSFQAYAKESINTIIINGKPITTTIDVGIKATKQYVARALGNSVGNTIKGEFNATSFADEIIAINKTTEGGGRLLSTTPLSVINSAIYYETAAEQGSSIFRSIIKNHMFYDGNKRTAVAAFQSFAKQHGLTTVSQQQMMNVANQVATGHVTEILQISKLLLK
ncbi:type II toxin-antitoxin system death-on-curing family toxin [Flectobacillus major]|uniref:type II toxin-antitoxin system death-on-curing family toxin n=1 Tax=Flectobacillus major TaxID=103 RepID=UPI001E5B8569|nr:type II toxin-antitoxin system death-on-curing family toxin [Flectobacillus major]